MIERFYHYKYFEQVQIKYSNYRKKGFKERDQNVIMAQYKFNFDPDLSLSFCSAQRISSTYKNFLD